MSQLSNEQNSTRNMGLGMVIAMWVIVLGLLTAYFTHWQDKQFNPNQSIDSIVTEGQERQVWFGGGR